MKNEKWVIKIQNNIVNRSSSNSKPICVHHISNPLKIQNVKCVTLFAMVFKKTKCLKV